MARTVDPERHRARRLLIIDAGLTRFAADGYAGATTASICREAGISSGTFFHYFPTKSSLLLAILELGAQEVEDWFAAQVSRPDAEQVITDFVAHAAAEAADPRTPGFVRAVGAIMTEPDVAAALEHDERVRLRNLQAWVAAAQKSRRIRTDLSADRLAQWVLAVLDGYLNRLSVDGFDAVLEQDQLGDVVSRLLAPVPAQAADRPLTEPG